MRKRMSDEDFQRWVMRQSLTVRELTARCDRAVAEARRARESEKRLGYHLKIYADAYLRGDAIPSDIVRRVREALADAGVGS